jgi:hypothetical protein
MSRKIASMVWSVGGSVQDLIDLVKTSGLRGAAAQSVADRALLYVLTWEGRQ